MLSRASTTQSYRSLVHVAVLARYFFSTESQGLNGDVIFKVGAIEGHYDANADVAAATKAGVFDVLLFPSALRSFVSFCFYCARM